MKTIKGIITPTVTPLRSRNELDRQGLARLCERLIENGVAGLFMLGTTGEFPSLTPSLRRDLVRETVRIARGRVPVLAGISDTCLDLSLQYAGYAADDGADALVVTAPYYFQIDNAQIVEWLKTLADRSPLPLILYNMPKNTKIHFDLDIVRFVLDHPKFVAMKDSSGNLDYFWRVSQMVRDREDFALYMGPEHLLAPAVAFGADGGVNSGSNLDPRTYVAMYSAAVAGDRKQMDVLQRRIDRINAFYHVVPGDGCVVRALKCALSALHICDGELASPLLPLGQDEREKALSVLEPLTIDY